jgi:ankyrin repeat protein
MLLREEPLDVNYDGVGNLHQTSLSRCILKAQTAPDPTGHVDCVELLLENGADPGTVDLINGTPLRYAADAVRVRKS